MASTKAAMARQIARLISERDREAALSAVAVARAGELEQRAEQAEAARDEAATLLRAVHQHHLPPPHICESHGPPVCTFLAGLSTVTEKGATEIAALESRSQHKRLNIQQGKPMDENCERVSVCCERPELEPTGFCKDCDGRDFKCATHHGPWGECPEAGG